MSYKIHSDKSIINLNNILIDDIQLCIKNFILDSLSRYKNNYDIYFRLLFSGYINYNKFSKFSQFSHKFSIKDENIFGKFLNKIEELFEMIISVNIMNEDHHQHIKLILLLNYIKRLIYENRNIHDSVININMPLSLPEILGSSYRYRIHKLIENYGSGYGIINLLGKLNWINIKDNSGNISFEINENLNLVKSLETLISKLGEIYNNISKIERFLIELFSFSDVKLIELLETDIDNKNFILWKKYLNFQNSSIEMAEVTKIDILESNYEYFLSSCDYSEIHCPNKKIIYEGII